MLDPINIGVVCSSGGSVVMAAGDLYEQVRPGRFRWFVVTDRACGIESACRQRAISCARIDITDRKAFSRAVADHFNGKGGVRCVLLFFLRLVSGELYGHVPTLNFHPSLLPAFTGFKAIERAIKAHARYLGATLHMADGRTDGGQIVSQSVYPLVRGISLELAHRISFAQKLYLCLGLLDMLDDAVINFEKSDTEGFEAVFEEEVAGSFYANPAIGKKELVEVYNAFLKNEGLADYQITNELP